MMLALCLVVSLFSIPALAEEDTVVYRIDDCMELDFDKSTGTITQGRILVNEVIPELRIPDEIEGVPVTVIGDRAFEGIGSGNLSQEFWQGGFKRVVLPAHLKAVGDGAFYFCAHTEEVEFPNDLESLDHMAFGDCSLKSVILPASLNDLAYDAFGDNRNLKELKIDPANPVYKTENNVVYADEGKTLYLCPEGYRGSLIVPEGVEYIGREAVLGCWRITDIWLPVSLQWVFYRAFQGIDSCQQVRYEGTEQQWNDILFWNKLVISYEQEELSQKPRLYETAPDVGLKPPSIASLEKASDGVRINLSGYSDGDVVVFAATYNGSGRMLNSASTTVTPENKLVASASRLSLDLSGAVKAKAFLLDPKTGAPLAKSEEAAV